jgi:superfamily I DNA/RNA helicase
MEYIITTELNQSIKKLQKYGGNPERAAKKVWELVLEINASEPGHPDFLDTWKITNNGENRIKKCIKYSLAGGFRLVTVRSKGKVILLYVGKHDDVDKWLDRYNGTDFTNIDKNGQVTPVRIRRPNANIPSVPNYDTEEVLTQRVDLTILEPLLVSLQEPMVAVELASLKISDGDDKFLEVCSKIDEPRLQDTWLNVLTSLVESDVANVKNLVKKYQGLITPMSKDVAIVDSTEFIKIPTNSPEWAELYKHFAMTADYKDWMLFLHPEQKFVVEQHYEGPSKLLGVSGSGKTCVAIKRAIYLAEKYSDDNILLLTLNKSLAKLIQDLVLSAAPKELSGRISVKPFFEICQELLYEFELGSEKYYRDITWKSDEHIDEIWSEYYQCQLNVNEAEVLHPVHDSLISQGINAEAYIREEFDWIRSAIPEQQRKAYLKMKRTGRSVSMQAQYREALLSGLEGWEKKMKDIGVIDNLGIVAALQPHVGKLQPMFRSILVDESQDFGTSELAIIRRLVAPGENDLFLCGDAAQKVQIKSQSLKEAGIVVPQSAQSKLIKNYRNSYEVLTAAHQVLTKHMTEELLDNDNFEILDPEYADFNGSTPLILEADNLAEEIEYAVHYITEEISHNSNWKACIAIAGYSLYEIQRFGNKVELPVLDGTIGISDEHLYLSDLAQSKGFEFDIMIVVNLSDGVMPNILAPESEHFNDLATLYVAMTRAKTQLILSFNHKISPLLVGVDEELFLLDNWAIFCEKPSSFKYGSPMSLDEMTTEEDSNKNIAEMTGMEFLYTSDAIGLSIELITRLRDKVGCDPGRHDTRDIGWMHQNVKDSPKEYNSFGRELSSQLIDLGVRLDLERLHKNRLIN